MLRVISKFALDIISKNLIISKILLKKIFKSSLYHQGFGFVATFVLVLLLNRCFIEEQGSKKDIIRLINSNNFKIILTLLTKMVIVYMQVFIIKVKKIKFLMIIFKAKS